MGRCRMRIYNQNIWGNMKPEHKIANRNLLIHGLISKYDPDVCGFQECNPKTSRAGDTPIASLLSDFYNEVFPENADHNFTPLFYHRERMTCIDCGWFLFDGKNDKNSKSVTWAILEEKASGKLSRVKAKDTFRPRFSFVYAGFSAMLTVPDPSSVSKVFIPF